MFYLLMFYFIKFKIKILYKISFKRMIKNLNNIIINSFYEILLKQLKNILLKNTI